MLNSQLAKTKPFQTLPNAINFGLICEFLYVHTIIGSKIDLQILCLHIHNNFHRIEGCDRISSNLLENICNTIIKSITC